MPRTPGEGLVRAEDLPAVCAPRTAHHHARGTNPVVAGRPGREPPTAADTLATRSWGTAWAPGDIAGRRRLTWWLQQGVWRDGFQESNRFEHGGMASAPAVRRQHGDGVAVQGNPGRTVAEGGYRCRRHQSRQGSPPPWVWDTSTWVWLAGHSKGGTPPPLGRQQSVAARKAFNTQVQAGLVGWRGTLGQGRG